jgi:para-aminobenzoate synthetase/4-amino-4-deoxychorismate lyase
MEYRAVIQDKQGSRWLGFHDPIETFAIQSIEDVIPTLEGIERQVNLRDLYAVGFIGYEASPAFDSALRVRDPGPTPLAWFGLFTEPEQIDLPSQPTGYDLGEWAPSVSREDYNSAIESIKELIAAGRTYQVNYTIRLTSSFSGDPWGLFVDLNHAQNAQYGAFIKNSDACICSASPELFFELAGDELVSRPMKGTVERGLTLAEDNVKAEWLRNSPKNRAENVMIVDMIRNDMGRVSQVGTVHVPRLFDVERYPTVWQMTSTVHSRTSASITEILTSLFPCASITGAPKVSTMDIISDLESSPRGIYTGCIGYMSPGRKAQFSVAIRTVVINRQDAVAEYGVGGGIVWDSTAADEYQECQTKALVLTERRPSFKLLESILWTPNEGYFLLEEHLRRLADSADYFDFTLDLPQVHQSLEITESHLADRSVKVRLQVSRNGAIEIEYLPIGVLGPARLALARQPIMSDDVFLYHKTTHRNVYARAKRGHEGFDDVLLWNEKGEITETTAANIVVEMDGALFTPPVESGLLPGVFRSSLLEKAKIEERVITLDDVERSDSLYAINSVRKWRKATLVSEHASRQLSRP